MAIETKEVPPRHSNLVKLITQFQTGIVGLHHRAETEPFEYATDLTHEERIKKFNPAIQLMLREAKPLKSANKFMILFTANFLLECEIEGEKHIIINIAPKELESEIEKNNRELYGY